MQKQEDKGDAFANLLNTLAANGVKIDTADSTSSSVNDVSDNTTEAAAADTACESNALDVSKNSELINSSNHALSVEEAASVEKDDSIEADMDKDFADINGCIEADTKYKRYIEGESDELDTLKVRNYDKKEEVDTHTEGLEVVTSNDAIEDITSTKSTSISDTPSNDKHMAAYALISTAKRKSPPKSSSSTTTQSIPLKSSHVDSKTSLLTKGMSYFGRSTNTTTPKQSSVRYNNKNSDTQSVMSEISTDVKSTISSAAKAKQDKEDIILKQHLKESGLILLKRLIEFLSECPPTIDEGSLVSEWRRKKESKSPTTHQKKKKRARGLTLPASAIGWLSSQLLDDIDDTDILDDVPRQQLDCVHMSLRRVTSLRISGEVWPPPHPSTMKGKSKKNLDEGKKSLTTNLLSKLAIDTGSIDDESSCGTGPSTVYDVISPPTLSKFQYYHHEIQYNPNVNMIFFPNVNKLVINGIPPNWISNLDTCKRLDVFQLERGCILDVNLLFFPGDVIPPVDTSIQEDSIPRNLSLIDENMEKKVEATTLQQQSADDDDIKQQPILSATPFEYKSISKLKLANCAMGETAGLRGIKRRRRSNNVPRIPPLARFPNLTSLNLSNNELFKSKTVFAGLSALPLLSSIDLSYNRLSSLDDIFMHIGNVTEFILTGNEISSTRGLDRLFSLERLSLDENNICNLANISGIAKLPFLMNFDLKGNPLESEDPAACRIKVFNLFREVRCNNLPKNATFRDMQRLLPVLDNEVAIKNELVALKDLTFRQTVISVDSMVPPTATDSTNNDNDGDMDDGQQIDESNEISINMPDQRGGMRRVVKSGRVNTAHLRIAGSDLLNEKAATRIERLHCEKDNLFDKRRDDIRHTNVQFDMKDLITSIRPVAEPFILREQDGNSQSCLSLTKTSSSHGSGDEDVIAEGSSPKESFPYRLPSSILSEADDEVWNPTIHADLVIPSDTFVWDLTPSDDNEQGQVASDEGSSSLNGDDDKPSWLKEEHDGGDEGSTDSDPSNQHDRKERKIISEIWEQSYRENITPQKNTLPLKTTHSSDVKPTQQQMVDFNAAEKDSQYDGPSDYKPLFVATDLDLYFDSYIFHHDSVEEKEREEEEEEGGNVSREITAPRIQLFKFDRDTLINSKRQEDTSILPSELDFSERYVGVWKEDVLACGPYARTRLSPIQMTKRGFHGDPTMRNTKDVMVSEGRKFILCLSDVALYFIVDDEVSQKPAGSTRTFPSRIPPNSTFSDAYWPHAVIRHPLNCLRGITIGFQFQRLILRFCIGNASSSFEYTYVILTSNKLQTVSLLQKLQSLLAAIDSDRLPGLETLIDNDDKTFLDELGAPRSNEVVMHYSILHQIWKRGDREASRRAFVITDARVYLLDEYYIGDGTNPNDDNEKRKKLGDVSFAIIDSAKLNRVTEVRAANEDPRKITLVILPQNKLKRSHRWRLVCGDGEGAERLIEDVRKALA